MYVCVHVHKYIAECGSASQCAVSACCCSVLEYIAKISFAKENMHKQRIYSQRHTATHFYILQHTATHYHTLQHITPQKSARYLHIYVYI